MPQIGSKNIGNYVLTHHMEKDGTFNILSNSITNVLESTGIQNTVILAKNELTTILCGVELLSIFFEFDD